MPPALPPDQKYQMVKDWVPAPLAPRSNLALMPAALTVPNLRHFDSTDSWSPHTKWPSTPVPDDSNSNVPDNTADLITSDDPWFLDAAIKLILEKIPQSISCNQPEFETIYGFLKGCSDTRLPLELFALSVNLMEALPGKGAWIGRWMDSRPVHGTVHEQDDCQPEGDPIFHSSQGYYLPAYFRPANATPPPPPELFVLAILACSNNMLAACAHPMSADYDNHNSAHWAIIVSRARFGVSQVRVATQVLWNEIKKMSQGQVWGKMHKRMDQIERHAARTAKEEVEDDLEGMEEGEIETMAMRKIVSRGAMVWEPYQGTGVDWDDEEDDDDHHDGHDSGVNQNVKYGTEETRSVTVNGWLDGIE